MVATSMVESNLDPGAVGDNGTSFGLFQHHIGGAGGPNRESAIRFHDPKTSINERARAFKGGSGGAWAASIQRPADPAGYAQKVDQWIQRLKRGNVPMGLSGGAGATQAANTFAPQGQVSSGKSRRERAFELLFEDDPEFLDMIRPHFRGSQDQPAEQADGVPDVPVGMVANVPALPRKNGEEGWQYLQRLGSTLFGLQNDPGQAQTIGGRHATNSFHYSGRAIDFGDARNSRDQLNAWMQWVDQNREALGVTELLDEGDHIHVAVGQ
jgi:hypothetical protein